MRRFGQSPLGGLSSVISGLAAGAALSGAPAGAMEVREAESPDGRDRMSAPAESAAKLDVVYTADFWRNLRGGQRRNDAYLDKLQAATGEVPADRC